jgi:hypothetical protein
MSFETIAQICGRTERFKEGADVGSVLLVIVPVALKDIRDELGQIGRVLQPCFANFLGKDPGFELAYSAGRPFPSAYG